MGKELNILLLRVHFRILSKGTYKDKVKDKAVPAAIFLNSN